jgi:DNA-binding MarR family transcriptional regulator
VAGPIDDDERTNAVGLFNTARSYWRSAVYLNAGNLGVTHPQAPVIFLFCHAIELYLKAYLRGTAAELARLKKLGHRVADLAKAAADSGLHLSEEQFEILSHIDEADVALESRYIVTGFKTLPTDEGLAKVAEALDNAVCAALSNLGVPVRAEQFQRPSKGQREDDLGEDAHRVLVYLFRAHADKDARDVGVIATQFGMDRGMLEYHLDRLDEAKFAENTGFNYLHGTVYWAITPEGRKYVVDRKLIS